MYYKINDLHLCNIAEMKVSVWGAFIPYSGFCSWHTKLRIYVMFYTCSLSPNVRLNTCQSNKAECPVWSCFKAMSRCTFFISCTHAIFINPTSLFPANWSQSSEAFRLYAAHHRLADTKWSFRCETPLANVSAWWSFHHSQEK